MSARSTSRSATLRAGFGMGYQDALRDVAEIFDRDGADAARTYLRDNINPTTERQTP